MAVSKVILNGETLIDVTQKTVTPSNMLSGITALKNDGTDITGSIAAKSAADLITSGSQVTVPSGMYAAAATTAIASASWYADRSIYIQPDFSVSSSGVVTVTGNMYTAWHPIRKAGYIDTNATINLNQTGTSSYQLSTAAGTTIIPTTSSQIAVASGKYTTGIVTVVGDSALIPSNIAAGVSIFGVEGTHQGGGNDFTIEFTKINNVWTPDKTLAEIQTAYNAGKTFYTYAEDNGEDYLVTAHFNTNPDTLWYDVCVPYWDSATQTSGFTDYSYHLDSNGIHVDGEYPVCYTNDADAVDSDVASGKIFYNANGRVVGTASGGGAATSSYYVTQDSEGYLCYSSVAPSGGEYYIFNVSSEHIEPPVEYQTFEERTVTLNTIVTGMGDNYYMEDYPAINSYSFNPKLTEGAHYRITRDGTQYTGIITSTSSGDTPRANIENDFNNWDSSFPFGMVIYDCTSQYSNGYSILYGDTSSGSHSYKIELEDSEV